MTRIEIVSNNIIRAIQLVRYGTAEKIPRIRFRYETESKITRNLNASHRSTVSVNLLFDITFRSAIEVDTRFVFQ